jgi:hypothetical protein
LKSHILLSGLAASNVTLPDIYNSGSDPDNLFGPLSADEHSGEAFLQTWQDAHSAIKRHVYRGPMYQHPHYIQADLFTGAVRAFWIDSLSAYYPGLLTLAGELEELSRLTSLPQHCGLDTRLCQAVVHRNWEHRRWSWMVGGRPEFIESTYYLYRATQDPWYLHVGEMVLRDIKRRCWTKCGWAGLQDVGMESKMIAWRASFSARLRNICFYCSTPRIL